MKFASLLLTAAAATAAMACFDGPTDTVFFHSDQPDFGAPPPRYAIPYWKLTPERPGMPWSRVNLENGEGDEGELADRWQSLQDAKAKAVENGQWRQAAEAQAELLELGWEDANFGNARLELYQDAAQAPNSDRAAIEDFLSARDLYENGYSWPVELQLRALKPSAPAWLRPHIDYTLAAILFDREANRGAFQAFLALADAHPEHPRAEAALIMAARTALGDMRLLDFQDADYETALAALDRLLTDFPETRFRKSADGWRGRAHLLAGRYDEAIALYAAQAETADPWERWQALNSLAEAQEYNAQRPLAIVTHLRQLRLDVPYDKQIEAAWAVRTLTRYLDSSEERQLARIIPEDPEALAAYLEFRKDLTQTTQEDLQDLLDLGLRHQDVLASDARAIATLGELAYHLGNYEQASDLVNQALEIDPDQPLAHYVSAAAQEKLGFPEGAFATFSRLAEQESPYQMAARENVLRLSYASGDLVGALRAASDLYYAFDIALLADVLMDPEQVVEAIPDMAAWQNRFHYALGLRHLRRGDYTAAREAFDLVPSEEFEWMTGIANPDSYATFSAVGLDRLYDPRATARALSALDGAINSAADSTERAEALYEKASYIYEKRNLLFYNADLWMGARTTLLGFFLNRDLVGEDGMAAVAAHFDEHDPLAVAMRLAIEAGEADPSGPVAPRAFYRAACAAHRLALSNGWWRSQEDDLDHLGLAVALMNRVAEEYPDSDLAADARKFGQVFEEDRADWQRISSLRLPVEF